MLLVRFMGALCAFALLCAATSSSQAQERYRRDWSDHPGMPRQIQDVDYDDHGFLWLGSEEGVHRFDGHEVVPWGQDVVRTSIHFVNRGPEGQILAFTAGGAAYEVTETGLAVVTGPSGEPLDQIEDADYAPDGGLWVCAGTSLLERNAEGRWTRIESPQLVGQSPSRVRGAVDGGAWVGTFEGRFLRVGADRTARTLHDDPTGRVVRIAVRDARVQGFLFRFGPNHGIYLVEDGEVRPVYRKPETGRRWTGLAFREGTLWAVATSEIVAVSEDGRRIDVLGPEQGFHPGGIAVVDHEKNLWLTSFRGIYQFPEPDVVLYTEMDGTRQVERVGSETLANRWEGPHLWDGRDGWTDLTPEGYHLYGWGGVSPWQTNWFVGVQDPGTPRRRSALLERRGEDWAHHLTREFGVYTGAYAIAESGTFWIAFHDTLWRVLGEGAAPEAVAPMPNGIEIVNGIAVREGRVTIANRGGDYCEGTLTPDRDALEGEWRCEPVTGAERLTRLLLVDDGPPWVATHGRGVVRRGEDGWESLLGEAELGTDTIRGISVSPRGGVWVITDFGRVRVEWDGERTRIVERLGPWIGVPNWMMFGATEEPDGTIWLAGMTSAIRIPAHARQRPTTPPPVYVTGFRADGRDLAPASRHELPATTRRIELSWAAPAFRDPASLRYQVRADSTGDWMPTRERSFRFVDLGPGDYRFEVRASLDGENWSEAKADVRFAIRSPLWRRPSSWAAAFSLLLIGTLLVQWLRTRQQVRLERQRTGIAMNLHDELGAGLASIGLLTDLAVDDELEPGEGREVAARVGEISRDLTRSLSDIVWTLRPRSADLAGFALFLRQRAADLLSGGDTAVEFEFPDPLPAIALRLEVRRQIHAIASEALHNTAKHAQASRVRVGLAPDGNAWILRIVDDGVGLDHGQDTSGLGLASMRKRAAKIGAKLSLSPARGGGCCLELRFMPRVEGRP